MLESPLQVGLAQQMSYLKETLSGDREARSHPKRGDIFTLLPVAKLLELNLHLHCWSYLQSRTPIYSWWTNHLFLWVRKNNVLNTEGLNATQGYRILDSNMWELYREPHGSHKTNKKISLRWQATKRKADKTVLSGAQLSSASVTLLQRQITTFLLLIPWWY